MEDLTLSIRRHQLGYLRAGLYLKKAFPEASHQVTDMWLSVKRGVTVKLSPYTEPHTDSQRGYYHMWKNAFAQFCGNTPDEMHEYILCQAYGSEAVRTRTGVMIRPLKRSSTRSVGEYSFLIDTLIRVAANMGFVVPPPL